MENIFAILSIPIICLIVFGFRFLSKHLEHKQIMAAIEKGMPLSELRPAERAGPSWIKNLTAGIALLIVGLSLAFILIMQIRGYGVTFEPSTAYLAAAVLSAIGISLLVRGLLLRKAQRQHPASDHSKNGPE